MYAINLPWEQSNDVLQWAIDNRVHLRITVRFGRDWIEVPSQFIGGKPLKELVIQQFYCPWTEKMLIGQLLPCSFRKGNSKLLFVSAVVDMRERQNDNSEEVEKVYVLSWPEGLQQMQRRLFYRASIPEDMDLKVRVWESVPVIDKAPEEEPIVTGKLTNISVGGAEMEVDSSQQLMLNHSYLLQLELPAPESPLLVIAQTRRIEAVPGTSAFRFGMQFLSLDNTQAGQGTMVKLARFANYIRSLQYREKNIINQQ